MASSLAHSHRSLSRLFSTFPPPPHFSPRRVVITGLGMVTPLGCGVAPTWRRLVEGRCGVRALEVGDLKMGGFEEEVVRHAFEQLSSKVVAAVPRGKGEGDFDDELCARSQDQRFIATFIAYALCAADEALKDANWMPTEVESRERTGVSVGGELVAFRTFLTRLS